MNEDIFYRYERGHIVTLNRTWYFCLHNIQWTEIMKRQNRIFALVQYVKEFDKHIKMGGTMRSVGGIQNV
jgi:hypothetical protein